MELFLKKKHIKMRKTPGANSCEKNYSKSLWFLHLFRFTTFPLPTCLSICDFPPCLGICGYLKRENLLGGVGWGVRHWVFSGGVFCFGGGFFPSNIHRE